MAKWQKGKKTNQNDKELKTVKIKLYRLLSLNCDCIFYDFRNLEVTGMATVGMFDSILFDNSKLIMFDDWNVSFLRKKKSMVRLG
jgi:hypothetical protein